jgi:sterol desaturase/sphingolipid hydroxylase (fatty acid hydroxylase superfamily)
MATFLIPTTLITIIELIDHRNFPKVKRSFIRGSYNWLVYFSATFFILKFSTVLSGAIHERANIDPIIDLSQTNWYGLELFVALFVFDFFYYWFHRLQHTIPFLWQFHEFHHAIEDLNAANSAHHWSEEFWRIFFVSIPMSLLVMGSTNQYLLISGFIAFWGIYIHTDARSVAMPYIARFVVADNVYHHAHHGLEEKYHNKNYAAFFPFWDILFRSVIIEDEQDLPNVGVQGKSLPGYLGMLKLKVERNGDG